MGPSGADMALRRGLARPLVARRREEPVIRRQTDESLDPDAAGALVDHRAYHARLLAGWPGAFSAADGTYLSRRCPYPPGQVCLGASAPAKERISASRGLGHRHAVTRPARAHRRALVGVRSRSPVIAKHLGRRAWGGKDPAQLPNARGLNGSFQEIRHAYLPFWLGPF
jgi:hypothetical protein